MKAKISTGLKYMLASAVFYSIMSVMVKFAGRTMHSQQIVLARAVIALVLSYGVIRRLKISPWGESHYKLLILRGVLGFCGLTCFFYAITHLPLGDSTVLQYTNPIFTALVAGILLKERLGRVEVLGALGSLIGVALIARPSFLFGAASTLNPLAVGMALLGAVISAFAYTTVRSLSGKEHPMVVVFYFPLVATPLAIPTAWPVLKWPTPVEWLLLLGVGICTQIAQVYMTKGLHLEKAGKAMSVTYTQIVFAFVWGMLFFGEIPSWLSVLGTVIIMGCSGMILHHNRVDPANEVSEK